MEHVAIINIGESSRNDASTSSTRADEENAVSKDDHKEHRCCLDQYLQRGDSYHLTKLLHSNIWLRFCLRKDEHTFELFGDHEQESHTPTGQVFHYHYVNQDFSLGNSESVLPAGSSGLVYDTELSFTQKNTAALQHYSNLPLTAHVPLVDFSVLFSPWFVLSATFAGCPKLLQYILSVSETGFLQESHTVNVKPDVSETRFLQESHTVNVKPDVSETRFLQEFRTVNVKPDVSEIKFLQESRTDNVKPDGSETGFLQESRTGNVKPDVSSKDVQDLTGAGLSLKGVRDGKGPVEFTTGLYDKRLQPCHLGACQLVNRRTACEFPICDTWVHKSEYLMVSPLHLACWRHDFTSIVILLQHGADPNALALEEVPDNLRKELLHTDSTDSIQGSFVKLSDALWFYNDKGLSPLHFIALGVRSQPKHSIVKGCEAGIIHDTCSLFQQFHKLVSSASYNILSCSVDYSQFACVEQTTGQSSVDKNVQTATQCELIVNCLDVLLHAGAKPNQGQSLTFKGAYALDIFLQPPTKVYYAPSAARYSQTSESQRLYDLEHNASQVVAACKLLLRHDAQLSPAFLATYKWRPELLDCFHLGIPGDGWQLIHLLVRLGVFNDRCCYDLRHGPDAGLASISVFTNVCIHRFIVDVMNTSIPPSLTSLIFKWCSVNMLHDFIRTISKIAEMSSWNVKLRELFDTAISLQMRSLKHSCFYVILSSVRFRCSAIWSLPLPVPLKRELTELDV